MTDDWMNALWLKNLRGGKKKKKNQGGGGISTHLYHTCTGIQKDAAFGFFGYFFIFVKIHDVGVIWQLSQLEVALFEGLNKGKDTQR